MTHSVVFIITLATVTLAAIVDIYKRRIPNIITVPAFFTGLAIHYMQAGWTGILNSLLGFLLGFTIFFVLWLLGGRGAGDAKLIGAVGALLGPRQLLMAFVLIGFAGGVLAVIYIWRRAAVLQTLENLAQFPAHVKQRITRREMDPAVSPLMLQNPAGIKIPYGVPIAVGTILSFLF